MRKIVRKTKIDRIRNRPTIESCGIQPVNEWVERRIEWAEHVIIMDAKRLVKILMDHVLAGRPKGRRREWLKQSDLPITKKKKINFIVNI